MLYGMAGVVATGAGAACIWRPDFLAALTLIPAWYWLICGLLSTGLAWCKSRRRTVGALAGLWIIFVIGWVEEIRSVPRAVGFNAKSEANSVDRAIRIVSLNCANEVNCVVDLERVHPDVVLLQEAPGIDGLAQMTARLFGAGGSFLSGGDTAILTRGKLNQLFADRSAHFVAGTVQFEDGRRFDCVSLRLAPPPSRLDFWSPGFWRDHRDARNMHRHQLRQIMASIPATPSASVLVIGGDFNTVPLDRALDELRPNLCDTFDKRGLGWGATGTNEWPLFRVDQVWTSAQFVPVRVAVGKTKYSDHRMVICDAVVSHR